jgi:drug/metabolite transporter (DMT)-like permease
MALGGIARVSQVQLLQTFLTLGFAALLLGERVDATMLGFAVLTVFWVWRGRTARVR